MPDLLMWDTSKFIFAQQDFVIHATKYKERDREVVKN